jgi:hypothetical protein
MYGLCAAESLYLCCVGRCARGGCAPAGRVRARGPARPERNASMPAGRRALLRVSRAPFRALRPLLSSREAAARLLAPAGPSHSL